MVRITGVTGGGAGGDIGGANADNDAIDADVAGGPSGFFPPLVFAAGGGGAAGGIE